jgi:hypothetical protein
VLTRQGDPGTDLYIMTVTAVSRANVMVVPAERVDRDRLVGLAAVHRRELPLRSR